MLYFFLNCYSLEWIINKVCDYMENLNILIGQRLNRLRKDKNLSLEELSL